MSKSSSQSNSNVPIECKHPTCDNFGKMWELRDGKYCSTECETKHTGRKKLTGLKYDHTHCYTCFTQLKTIEPPKPDHAFSVSGTGWTWDPEEQWWTIERYGQEYSRKSAIGFQHTTPDAGFGEKEFKSHIVTGTICDQCGNTDHTAHLAFLVDERTTAARVVNLLVGDDTDFEFSIPKFHREYEETTDLELALGRALE